MGNQKTVSSNVSFDSPRGTQYPKQGGFGGGVVQVMSENHVVFSPDISGKGFWGGGVFGWW